MSFRVAVASSDGKYVNEHFGRAQQFLIFDLTPGGYQFLELRKNEPSCRSDQTDEVKHLPTIDLLEDCQGVLVARIGPGAEAVLNQKGIQVYVILDFIDEALKQLLSLERKES
jgi:predicted Fe-Mo cluster-binding NifX family protein